MRGATRKTKNRFLQYVSNAIDDYFWSATYALAALGLIVFTVAYSFVGFFL